MFVGGERFFLEILRVATMARCLQKWECAQPHFAIPGAGSDTSAG